MFSSTTLTLTFSVTSARVTFAILPSTRIISAFPAVTVAAVVFAVGSFTVPLRFVTDESLLVTVSIFPSAIFTVPKVEMLANSASSFILRTAPLAPFTAPILLVLPFMSSVFPAGTLTERGLAFVPFTSMLNAVFAGTVREVILSSSLPVPSNVMPDAFVGRERVFTFASLLRVIVRSAVDFLYALSAAVRSSNVLISVPS